MSEKGEKPEPLEAPSIPIGGLHLAALWALAILQPLLNLLGNNPDFFVARDNTGAEIIVFVLLLAILPALLAALVEAAVNLVSPAARWLLHLVLCGLLFSAIALQVLKRFADGPAWPMIALALLLGVLLTLAYAKARFMRSMTDILIVAPAVILVAFFFFSGASKLTISSSEVHAKEVSAADPAPVVMVIFDEFPAGSLMTPSGEINRRRFPAFAGLKETSTWYRNTATNASFTAIAVPSILSGKAAAPDSLPTATDHPDSIFTLLGKDWNTRAIEPITQLCTEEICGEPTDEAGGMGDALSSLFTDLKTVSAHLLLPADMGSSLPDVSQSFQGFGENADEVERGRARQWVRDQLDPGENSLDGEVAVDRFTSSLPDAGQTFDFIHIEKPHYPWTHYPSGLKYSVGTEDFRAFIPESTNWEGNRYLTDRARQAHLLEVGFTDLLLGRIISALKTRGRWEETLFVATADHGAAWTKGAKRREAEPETLGQVSMVPLFIKAPGQSEGKVVGRPTCTTEIVPGMASILGIELPWAPAGCDRETIRMDNGTGPEVTLSFAETMTQRQTFIEQMAGLFGGNGAGWPRAFDWGAYHHLIGSPAPGLTSPTETRPTVEIIADVAPPAGSHFDPAVKLNRVLRQRGTVEGLEAGVPLAVSVNGLVVAVGQTYADGGSIRYSILIPERALREGGNSIELYEIVERAPDATPGAGSPAGLRRLWSSSDQ